MKRLIRSKNTYLILVTEVIVFLFVIHSFSRQSSLYGFEKQFSPLVSERAGDSLKILPAADLINTYIHYLKGMKIAIVANKTSVVGTGSMNTDKSYTHIVDTLLSLDIQIQKVFSPEHGFRGLVDAGEKVLDGKDPQTGLPVISLYGKHKKPQSGQLDDIDLVLFDIQDVGVRFYTYISTMSLVMEACAEKGVPMIVLDRPNPNGYYIDGPVLKAAYSSFLGMHEVPLVYGMTIGEYAKMVNGEGWLKDSLKCDLKVIRLLNYTHQSKYSLPVRPSPNLPNDQAINLYPSLGFFEGTLINAGRGTEFQFQRYGAPFFPAGVLSYVPVPNFGSKHPKFEGEKCNGIDLSREARQDHVNLSWLIDAYHKTPQHLNFFGKTFNAHAGNEELRKKIEAGQSAEEIRKSWEPEIEKFKQLREKYLIYP